jgi:dihydroorotate dehydrogenase
VLVKVSPDLADTAFAAAVDAVAASPAVGLVLSNTTLAREGLATRRLPEWGGVSGRPLHARMLQAVQRARQIAGEQLTLVGSGGIESGADARAARDAGADLVQLWTGLVYAGPGLIGDAIRRTT